MPRSAESFVSTLKAQGYSQFVGVPCSYLTPLIDYLIDRQPASYIPVNNEGEAVAYAVGTEIAGVNSVVFMQNSGLGNGFREWTGAVVRFNSGDGTVEVRHGWTEMGQGVHTVAMQVTVEELGIPAERIRVIVDTTLELGLGQTTGSRGTLMGAGAVQDACRHPGWQVTRRDQGALGCRARRLRDAPEEVFDLSLAGKE